MNTNCQQLPFLSTTSSETLRNWLTESNHPAFRAKQIHDWIFKKRIVEPLDMSNLPAQLKRELKNSFLCSTISLAEKIDSDDGVVKLLLRLFDDELIESVIIPSGDRRTFCLSTQVGCPVECRFCASGAKGLVRNLDAGEILEQFFVCCDELGRLPDNIVFMGIGEGLLNFANLVKALELISDNDFVGLGARRITVSTSGWTPGIKKLADIERQWNLAISLHAPNDALRAELIPDKFRKPIREIVEAADYYRHKTGRMVTFEYTIIAGLNDTPATATELATLAKKCRAKINLIPFNDVTGKSSFRKPSEEVIKRFEETLSEAGVTVTRRVEKGSSIQAACGQLRRQRSSH